MRRSISLVARIVSGAWPAIVVASSRTTVVISDGRHDVIDEARGVRVGSRDSMRPANRNLLGPTRAHEIDEPAVGGADRQLPSVARSAHRTWTPGVATRRSHADAIAQPPPAATPSTCAIVGFVDPLEPIEAPRPGAPRTSDRPRDRGSPELRDVGAGDERLAAGAAQNRARECWLAVDAVARGDERVVHLPRHRVARFGPVER